MPIAVLRYDLSNINRSNFEHVQAGRRGSPYFVASFSLEMAVATRLTLTLKIGRETLCSGEVDL